MPINATSQIEHEPIIDTPPIGEDIFSSHNVLLGTADTMRSNTIHTALFELEFQAGRRRHPASTKPPKGPRASSSKTGISYISYKTPSTREDDTS